MKIKVILTGGTVGSEKVNGVVKNNKDSNIALMWKEKFNSNIDFEVVNLYSILSENIKTENIEMLFAELRKDYSDYKGIIITHGSDTLSYTSAFVSIFCKDYKIPVVLTGADKVLSDPTSNGYSNFTTSVELIMDNRVGVWTVFDSIFSADSVMEADYFSDKFRSGNSPLTVTKCSKNITFNNKVAIIKMYPFIDFSMINDVYYYIYIENNNIYVQFDTVKMKELIDKFDVGLDDSIKRTTVMTVKDLDSVLALK